LCLLHNSQLFIDKSKKKTRFEGAKQLPLCKQGKKDYQEKLFTGFQLSECVPEDNFYRCLKGALDLSGIIPGTPDKNNMCTRLAVYAKCIPLGVEENQLIEILVTRSWIIIIRF